VSLDTLERALLVADTFIAHQERALAHLSKVEIPGLPPLQRRIAEAIVSLADRIEGGVIPTAMVTEKVNEGADERFHVTAQSVGKGVKALGLSTKQVRYHGDKARCISVTRQDLRRLQSLISTLTSGTNGTHGTKLDVEPVHGVPLEKTKWDKRDTQEEPEGVGVPFVPFEKSNGTPASPHEHKERPVCPVCPVSVEENKNNDPEADDEVEVII
jgi:hypothetical protein